MAYKKVYLLITLLFTLTIPIFFISSQIKASGPIPDYCDRNQDPCDPDNQQTCCVDVGFHCAQIPTVLPTPKCLTDSCRTLADKISRSFGGCCASGATYSNYDPVADLNKNTTIDYFDVQTFRENAIESKCRQYLENTDFPRQCPQPTSTPTLTPNMQASRLKFRYCKTTGLNCNDNSDCCSNRCSGINTCLAEEEPTTPTPAPNMQASQLKFRYCKTIHLNCNQDSDCCTNRCHDPDPNDNRSGSCLLPLTATSTPTPAPNMQASQLKFRYCKDITLSCDQDSDCCTNHCYDTTCVQTPPSPTPSPTLTPSPQPISPSPSECNKPRDLNSDGNIDGMDIGEVIRNPFPVALSDSDPDYDPSRDYDRDLDCNQTIDGMDIGGITINPFPVFID